uniref:Uncharacterized protein n=1 Tax=Hemiselmis andersenii TaxID=464988 RepID=A0A6U5CJY4_HEMAN|mmetsp:Transcript_7949/g.19450  ORF Transcript_7949/g.19450 Transcript_7949/m.19450 type:complete len:224 (+) Transcript_7949:67-738(+)
MGALFSKKKKYWVPEHRKMEDKLEDLSKWRAVEDMTGWQVQNSAAKIGEAMAKTKATAEVNLSYNGLGDDECESMGVAIKQTRTLKRLILANNHIHEGGAQFLAQALTPEKGKSDPTLEELDLMNNSIGPEGARAIAGVMTCNKRLKKINLWWNNIGNKGLEAICENLRKDYPRDFVLDVRYNGFDRSDPSVDWEKMKQQLENSKLEYEGDPEECRFRGWPEE